jgi:hypothetical protein
VVSGLWTSSTQGDNIQGLNYLYSLGELNGIEEVRWNYTANAVGYHTLYVKFPKNTPLEIATNATYTLTDMFGTSNIKVDQTKYAGLWYKLGDFYFENNKTYNITLSNNVDLADVGKAVLADSIKIFYTSEIDYSAVFGVAFDPINKKLWVADKKNNRLLRISNYDDIDNLASGSKLYVDMVLGQTSKYGICCNQVSKLDGVCPTSWLAVSPPNASTLCVPNVIKFDKFGNLYVIENAYECHGNHRIIMYTAEDISSATNMFPNLEAKNVFSVPDFTFWGGCPLQINAPHSPIGIAFNSKNEMIVGNDGYYINETERPWKQIYLYRDPLKKNDTGEYVLDCAS